MWLKLNEIHGGPQLINMDRVEHVTKETGGKAKLWFSADDADTLNVQEYFEEVQGELENEHVEPIRIPQRMVGRR